MHKVAFMILFRSYLHIDVKCACGSEASAELMSVPIELDPDLPGGQDLALALAYQQGHLASHFFLQGVPVTKFHEK